MRHACAVCSRREGMRVAARTSAARTTPRRPDGRLTTRRRVPTSATVPHSLVPTLRLCAAQGGARVRVSEEAQRAQPSAARCGAAAPPQRHVQPRAAPRATRLVLQLLHERRLLVAHARRAVVLPPRTGS